MRRFLHSPVCISFQQRSTFFWLEKRHFCACVKRLLLANYLFSWLANQISDRSHVWWHKRRQAMTQHRHFSCLTLFWLRFRYRLTPGSLKSKDVVDFKQLPHVKTAALGINAVMAAILERRCVSASAILERRRIRPIGAQLRSSVRHIGKGQIRLWEKLH